MKKALKRTNDFFIEILLFIFYFIIIGFGALIYTLFKKITKRNNTYWLEAPKEKLTIDNLKSAY